MTRTARRASIAVLAALAAIAAIIAADFTAPAAAQSEEETTGRIVARRLDDGRVEFGWQPTGGGFGRELTPDGNTIFRYVARVLPAQRYFPTDATVDRWLRSSPVEFGEQAIGRIEARLLSDGRIEFAFTPTDGERIEPPARYFPADARVGRWLRSTEITIGPAADATGYIAVSAYYGHACAIRTSGEIACWGENDRGQTDALDGSYSAVSTGDSHTCAIRESDSAIECWGDYYFHRYPINGQYPKSLSSGNSVSNGAFLFGNFVAVSAGSHFTCAIHDTGEIECLGTNRDSGTGDYTGQVEPPLGSYTAVSAGSDHACAIRTDSGAIECWGANIAFIGEPPYIKTGQIDAPTGKFTAVSAGRAHTCAIRESGEIECWGIKTWTAAGLPQFYDDFGSDTPAGSFTAVSAGLGHTCAIRTSGAIECWGDNLSGQTDAPEGRFTAVSAGGQYTCAIRTSGAIECWGDNWYGQTDAPTD